MEASGVGVFHGETFASQRTAKAERKGFDVSDEGTVGLYSSNG